ncbi:hypothetical protein B0H14DRAFT_3904293, partial [Mycena olivaceomarginata]
MRCYPLAQSACEPLVCFYERLFRERLSKTCNRKFNSFRTFGNVREGSTSSTSQLPPPPAPLSHSSLAMLSDCVIEWVVSAPLESPSDALAATRLTLNAIQSVDRRLSASQSSASIVLVIMELIREPSRMRRDASISQSVPNSSCRISGGRQRISVSCFRRRWRRVLLTSRTYSRD